MKNIILILSITLMMSCNSVTDYKITQEEQNAYNFFMSVHLENTFNGQVIRENLTHIESHYRTACYRFVDRRVNPTPIYKTKGVKRVPGAIRKYELSLEQENQIYQFLSDKGNWTQALKNLNQGVRDFNNRIFDSPFMPYYYLTAFFIENLNSPVINLFSESYSNNVKTICDQFVTKERVSQALANYNLAAG